MIIKRKFLPIISILMVAISASQVVASVLGDINGGYKSAMAQNADYYHYSYQSGDTFQKEYYVEYTPDSSIVPVVVNGSEIYGKRTILQATQYMKDNGMKPVMGINADYYSFKTGIPMGHTIIDGELVTSDPTGQNAVGFNSDGTGFISWLEIQSRFIKPGGGEMVLDCINKWCQPEISASYLLTDKFGPSTKTSGNCKFIIFSPVGGKLAIGESIHLRVDEKFDYDGEIAIPEGKLVLVMTNGYGDRSKLDYMNSLEPGNEVELKTESVYDKERWSAVQNGLGSVGGRLIENGKLNTEFEAGTAPRTAVGIKPDGKIIFYVIDGRQPEFSKGIQIKVLAARMAELGCIDALNLDGGGSTVMAGTFPDSGEMTVLNRPSEGSPRMCANYIFLKDNGKSQNDEPDSHAVFYDMVNHWAASYANELYHKGIVTGEDEDGKRIFRPESNISRGEFAVMVSRYMGYETSEYGKANFSDYDSIPDWQKPYVNAVAAEGIINGKDTDYGINFAGNDSITRAEAMTILMRTSKEVFEHSELNFADRNDIPDYAVEAVSILTGLGIVNGYEDGTLKPYGFVTRAESAKIISGCQDVLN